MTNKASSGGKVVALDPRQRALKLRFGLTRTQAQVALDLAEGLSYTEVAQRRCISPHTVHTHVKAIHGKTGVRSSRRLIPLIHEALLNAGARRERIRNIPRTGDMNSPSGPVAFERKLVQEFVMTRSQKGRSI